MVESSVKLRLQQIISEVKHDLSSNEGDRICDSLQHLHQFLPEYSLDKRLFQVLTTEQKIFLDHYYVVFLNIILNHLNSSWDGIWTPENEKCILDSYFLKGSTYDALVVLCRVTAETKLSYKLTKCLNLLESIITGDCIALMILDQCKVISDQHALQKREALWDDMVTLLISVPERLANKLHHNNRDVFFPDTYGKFLAANILQSLCTIYKALQMEMDCTIEFISHLIGRCCLAGYADIVLGYLLPHFLSRTASDFIWRRICAKLFNSIPDRCLESTVTKIIKTFPNPKCMSHLLGDCVLKNKKMHSLLSHKFLFVKIFENDLILQNILYYLAESDSGKEILFKVFNSLIEVWSDRSAMKHSSYEQHEYITRAIVMSAGLLKDQDFKVKLPGVLSRFTEGIAAHLHSPQAQIRHLGMVTGNLLAKILDPSGPELEFKFEKDAEAERLEKLLQPLETEMEDLKEKTEMMKLETVEKKIKQHESQEKLIVNRSSEQLDSDDDSLEAYDMSEDTVKTKIKKPAYLRDCIEGLIETKNGDRTEICLENAENLIRQQREPVLEVAVEFAKILLNLENNFSLPKFSFWREKALIALLTVCPIEVSEYLCEQFYDQNYSIRQRLDILDVLSISAQELSKLPPSKGKKMDRSNTPKTIKPTTGMKDWQEIIQQRIESKTKRFAKGPQKTTIQAENKFGDVAGHFFFPLMTKYDRKENTFDLLGQDCLVLGRLLYTLGIIMYSAVNTPISRRMGKSLMDFIWTLRYHTEAYIRRALLFCFSIILLSLPSHIITEDFQDDLLECSQWIKDSIQDDSDFECQKMASIILQLVSKSIRHESLPDTLLQ